MMGSSGSALIGGDMGGITTVVDPRLHQNRNTGL
jgi:hypothetical protein